MKENTMYYLAGDDHNEAVRELKRLGFDIYELFDCDMEKNEARVLSLDFKEKKISFFPLDIYAPGSPIANKEKFDHYMKQCRNHTQLKQDLIEWQAYEQEVENMELIGFYELTEYLIANTRGTLFTDNTTINDVRKYVLSRIETAECKKVVYGNNNEFTRVYFITINHLNCRSLKEYVIKVELTWMYVRGEQIRKSLKVKGGC